MQSRIDFYYGLGSRYSYLAASQISRFEAKFDCKFIWKPLFSGSLINLRQHNPFTHSSGQYDWGYRQRDAKLWADYYGIPFHEPKLKAIAPELLAIAVLAANRHNLLEAYSQILFKAIFAEQLEIQVDVLVQLATSLGIPKDDFQAALRSPDLQIELEQITQEASQRGAFGVPTFFVNDEMFWGNDRLVLLEHYLAQTGTLPRSVPV
ncbi:2-hydroxychromene-2-carboxylate isomerase [Pseudanabaena yagii]|uniref:2-hydroxychromene-2-carboxylate isomerase n=1 Tax=Pseudanabaena yagii GIHE-NHR1 TaxID=2722753 RepID=A0ABX1LMB9_9CYAN|nr:2-hydroxychromene-2-carboxylate isomerase [Pseudanabaena yagii]NMF56586.1 2-hydroxychromene-2-carboxylate isomerase [Pseudanabaena yagii GIHE-NHR1]